jgi:phosphoglycolate phosphatase
MLLIFDIDGTLFDGAHATISAVQQTFKQFGLVPPSKDEVTRRIGSTVLEYHAWLTEWCGEADPETVLQEADRLELVYLSPVHSRPYPGAMRLLRDMRKEGHVIATSTNVARNYFDAVMYQHDLREYIDIPLCGDDGFTNKVAMVAHAMKQCTERPAVVIGDRRDDVESAHANGAVAIGAEYGYGVSGELDDADNVIHSIAELDSILV